MAPNVGRMKLIATRDIAANEEIRIEYVQEGVWLQPRHIRRAILQANWGFQCICEGCDDNYFTKANTELGHINGLRHEVSLDLPLLPSGLALSNSIYCTENYVRALIYYGYVDRRLTEA